VRTLFTTWRLDRGINLSLIFEWDPRKAAANVGKHGIKRVARRAG